MKMNDLVLIEWIDSSAPHTGWMNIDEYDISRPYVCKSVGWIKKIEPHSILIVPNIAGNQDDGLGMIMIPRSAIKKVKKLC